MAKKRPIANPLALAVLALVWERPMHPYEMATTLRERHKEASIKLNYGSLYTVIESLVRAGLIVPQEISREGRRPERTVYALTDTGRTELRGRMRELLGVPMKEFPQFEAALALLPALPPDEVATLLEERVQRLDAEIRDRRDRFDAARGAGFERLFLVEGEYDLAMREAERAWVAALAADLTSGTWPIVPEWRTWHTEGRRPETSTPQ